MGMSTEDFNKEESRKIFTLLLEKTMTSWQQDTEMILLLINILVENGTLTSKQVQRTLKETT